MFYYFCVYIITYLRTVCALCCVWNGGGYDFCSSMYTSIIIYIISIKIKKQNKKNDPLIRTLPEFSDKPDYVVRVASETNQKAPILN